MKINIKKSLIISLVCAFAFFFATHATASTYFNTITNLWYTGRQTNVLQMAEARLARNTNDIAGVLMKASWDFAFSDAVVLSNSLNRVLTIGASVQTTNFINEFRITQIDVAGVLEYIRNETAQQRAADNLKENRQGLFPHFDEELKALDDDGYFIGEDSGR